MNGLVSVAASRTDDSASDVTTTASEFRAGVMWDPSVRFMGHIYF